jgi:hypothetical protein
MNKILGLFIGTIAKVIVMLGGYLLSLYAQKEISLVTIGLGILGFLIVYPAIERWEIRIMSLLKKDKK